MSIDAKGLIESAWCDLQDLRRKLMSPDLFNRGSVTFYATIAAIKSIESFNHDCSSPLNTTQDGYELFGFPLFEVIDENHPDIAIQFNFSAR